MSRVVTELVVDASGALQVLDRFGNKMDQASQSSDRATGGVSRYQAAVQRMHAQQERGLAITIESIARKSREQLAMERAAASIDKQYATHIKLSRQAEQTAVAMANAVRLGLIDEASAFDLVNRQAAQHQAILQGASAQQRSFAQSASAASAANDNLARSMHRVAGANDVALGSTANIAAQFQDIGVTAAMGMNPIMIALQQGTQLSAVLNSMQNPMRGLATALVSIINPVSLLTIGFVALGAAAIQWFSSAKGEADEAAEALERHDKWLDEILAGYQSVRTAANEAGEAASRLPQGIVELELMQGLKQIAGEALQLQTNIDAVGETIGRVLGDLNSTSAPMMFGVDADQLDTIRSQAEYIRDLGLSTDSTRAELDAAAEAARRLFYATDDPVIRDLADDVYKLATQLMGLRMREAETEAAAFKLRIEELGRALGGAVTAIGASYNAAVQASGGYIQAANAAVSYGNALAALGARIPAIAAQQRALAEMEVIDSEWKQGVKDVNTLLSTMAIGADEAADKMAALAALREASINQVTGLADRTVDLDRAERDAYIGSLPAKQAAIERLNDLHADRVAALQATIKSGADANTVQGEITRSAQILAQEVANVNTQFEQTAAKSGGAAKALKAAEQDFASFISTADRLAEKMFPGEYARREAEQLQALLDQHIGKLDQFQQAAIQMEVHDLFKAYEQNVRHLEDTTKDAARNMADELNKTVGASLEDSFEGAINDLSDFGVTP